ncbi:hypothetical protein HYFRA_00003890 [Hymenoscyphus fraxineus]|uniref:NAD(P)-binding protein n=1 Tax=Hymenoscyphus fraxineus TaxID=746836 RepID=A0A9N9L1K7_9HELO|nr:hypothetical protein HYFRA_00003890 [Hymenoscyphus fraxineus]
MATQEIVLITGANRGIGKGITTTYLAKPNHTVIAAVRKPSDPTSQSLLSLPKAPGTKLILIQLNSISKPDHLSAVTTLASEHGITHIDILIANAGIFPPSSVAPVTRVDHDEIRSIFEVNFLGTLTLIQTFFEALKRAKNPRFFVISSMGGSIGALENLGGAPIFAYGLSKAAVNYLVKACHLENKEICTMAFCPGWVNTDMGGKAAEATGLVDAPFVTMEDSMTGLFKMFDTASRETSGTYHSWDGSVISW